MIIASVYKRVMQCKSYRALPNNRLVDFYKVMMLKQRVYNTPLGDLVSITYYTINGIFN